MADEPTGPALDREVERVCFNDDLSVFNADRAMIGDRFGKACNARLSVYPSIGGRLSVSVRPGKEWSDSVLIPPQNADRPGFWDYEWLWNQRHGQPFCEGLEQIVAAYRAEPRPFSRDVRLAMGLLGDASIIAFNDDGVCVVLKGGIEGKSLFSEFPDAKDDDERREWAFCHAIARAVLAAKL